VSEKQALDVLQAVRECEFLSGAGEELIRPIAGMSRVIRQPRGTLVFDEGEPCRGMYIVRSGAIKLFKIGPDGREHVLHVVMSGDCFGEAAMFLGTGYPAAAQAVKDSTLLLVRREQFISLLEREPSLCFQLMGAMAMWARRLVNKVEILTLKDASARLAEYLLKQVTNAEGPTAALRLSIPKNVLAAQLGISSETLSRLLARFEAQGLISADGKDVEILNLREMEELAMFGSA
jgi:CRP/FNR family transcriptional regulator, dissimilatory nitrate respiration regulator